MPLCPAKPDSLRNYPSNRPVAAVVFVPKGQNLILVHWERSGVDLSSHGHLAVLARFAYYLKSTI